MPGQGNRIDFVTGAPEKYAALVDALSVAPNQYRAALGRVSDAVMRQEPAEPAGAWAPPPFSASGLAGPFRWARIAS